MGNKPTKPLPPAQPAPATATRRDQIIERLTDAAADFDELAREFRLRHRDLEDELAHIERSLEHRGLELCITPAECSACGYVFRVKSHRPGHAPRRCPECRAERVEPPWFRIEPKP